tara:strand:+ start:108 stop:488 length:381 start_codon:yes stop_codon:yes gene_type:complete
MKKTPVIIFVIFGLIILFAGTYSPEDEEKSEKSESAQIVVSGMRCVNCAEKIESAFSEFPGVDSFAVDFKTKLASVTFNPGLTTLEKISSVITELGFGGTNAKSCCIEAVKDGKSCGELKFKDESK